MSELTERWADDESEYAVLSDFLVPAAQAQYDRTISRWHALDTTALGFLAIDAAVIAGLVAARDSVHQAWWAAVLGYSVAGGFLIASAYPRSQDLGPDLVDLHDELRDGEGVDAARVMFDHMWSAVNANEITMSEKSRLFLTGLAVMVVSLVGSVIVVLFRP